MKLAVHDATGKEVETIEVDEAVFGIVPNEPVVHQALIATRANRRAGTASTKTRGEVHGSTKKIRKQKGTGNSRQGAITAPQHRHGGIVFGPRPRSYRTDLPRKVRQLARRSALNARAQGGQIYVIERLEFAQPKTSQLAGLLEKLELGGHKVLVLTHGHRPEVYLSGRNLPGVEVMPYQEASAYDVLWADAVLVEESAVGGHVIAGTGKAVTARAKRAERAAKGAARPRALAKKPGAKAKSARPAKTPQASKKKGAD